MFNQWEWMTPMPEAVLHPAVAAVSQRIYVFGGEDAMQNPVRLIQVKLHSVRCFVLFLTNHPLTSCLFCAPIIGLPHRQEHVVQDGEQNSEECFGSCCCYGG